MLRKNLEAAQSPIMSNEEIEKEIKRLASMYTKEASVELDPTEIVISEDDWDEAEKWEVVPTISDLIVQIKNL